ncbi:MAG: hypothetical protein P4L83_22310 [Nevskia sp.]|nr:hypothetical protein [Nevskia sp.]
MTPGEEVFRIHWRSPPVGLVVLWFGLAMWLAWPRQMLEAVLAFELVLALAVLFSLFTVAVGEDGVTVFRGSRVRWSQITAANRVRILGLPHLVVGRRNGGRVWLPLYLQGRRPLEQVLVERAPVGNPLRVYAEAVLAGRSRT